jgi:PhoPQ-activated pathogenicity-related protein
LDRYVSEPDPAYRIGQVLRLPVGGFTALVAELASQRWREPAEVDRTEWKHWLAVVYPERIRFRTAILLINGGSVSAAPPAPDPLLALLAAETGGVVADLRAVPNQPLQFAGEPSPLSEDALIAYSWARFLDTGDDRWPARLPMTKAVVRAMDAVTELLQQQNAGLVDRFILVGASKRGWTAWSAAAVDPRVIAIAPLVIDLLNLQPSFLHHYRCYGFWAPAISDYVRRGIMERIEEPAFRELLRIEDPYEYRGRLSLPKYIVNSAGDQFFLPDSSRFYWDDLPGEKYLRYVPNTDHALLGPDVVPSLLAWTEMILNGEPRPRFFWQADREARPHPPARAGQTEIRPAVEGPQPGKAGLPPANHRPRLGVHPGRTRRRRLRSRRGSARIGLDRILPGTHLRRPRRQAARLHDGSAGGAGCLSRAGPGRGGRGCRP